MLGANAGNMVCVVNVVAAASVVKLTGQEGQIHAFYLVADGAVLPAGKRCSRFTLSVLTA